MSAGASAAEITREPSPVEHLEAELVERRAGIDRLRAEADALEERREALALEAAREVPGAADRLVALEAEIATKRQQAEQVTLATRALRRELDEAIARQAAGERQELEQALETTADRRDRALERIGELVDEIAPLVEEVHAAAREVHNLSAQLGRRLPWRNPTDLIAGYLAYRCPQLSPPLPRPGAHDRGPMRRLPR